jgi:hypothetical protein
MGFFRSKRKSYTDPATGRVSYGLEAMRAEAEAKQRAADMERQQAERRAQGRNYVDGAFGQLNDDYFNNLRSSYANYFDSSVQNEYNQKRNELANAMQGTQGSAAFDFVGKIDALDREYQNRRGGMNSAADSYVNNVRGEVNNARNSLYSMAEGGNDPNAVLQNASGAVNSIRSRQFSPLGSFFANIAAQPGTSTAPNQPGGNVNYGSFATASGATNPAAFNIAPLSSARVVS